MFDIPDYFLVVRREDRPVALERVSCSTYPATMDDSLPAWIEVQKYLPTAKHDVMASRTAESMKGAILGISNSRRGAQGDLELYARIDDRDIHVDYKRQCVESMMFLDLVNDKRLARGMQRIEMPDIRERFLWYHIGNPNSKTFYFPRHIMTKLAEEAGFLSELTPVLFAMDHPSHSTYTVVTCGELECGETVSVAHSPDELYQHMQAFHGVKHPTLYVCPMCVMVFGSGALAENHAQGCSIPVMPPLIYQMTTQMTSKRFKARLIFSGHDSPEQCIDLENINTELDVQALVDLASQTYEVLGNKLSMLKTAAFTKTDVFLKNNPKLSRKDRTTLRSLAEELGLLDVVDPLYYSADRLSDDDVLPFIGCDHCRWFIGRDMDLIKDHLKECPCKGLDNYTMEHARECLRCSRLFFTKEAWDEHNDGHYYVF